MWYFNDGGVPEGPVQEIELRRRVLAGNLAPETLVWREGMEDWKAMNAALPDLDLPAPVPPAPQPQPTPQSTLQPPLTADPNHPYQTLASGTAAAAAASGQSSVPLAPVPMQNPYGTPQARQPYYAPPPPTLGLATTSMILGIVSIVLLFTCWLGLLCSIPAVITGHRALNQLRDAQHAHQPLLGHGQAKAGLWMGYIVSAICVLFLGLLAVGIMFG